jgi:hypothetical protein
MCVAAYDPINKFLPCRFINYRWILKDSFTDAHSGGLGRVVAVTTTAEQ